MGNQPVADRELDANVLDGCRQGDPEAQRSVFVRYGDRVFSIALRFLKGDRAAAQDVTQDVFVKVFRGAASFREDARLSTWLYRIAVNACVDELRRRRRLVLFGDVPRRLQPVVDPGSSGELAAEVRAAVERLSPGLRIAVLLRYVDDLTYEEIADVLRIRTGTVASRLSRAHTILARELAHLHPSFVPSEEGR